MKLQLQVDVTGNGTQQLNQTAAAVSNIGAQSKETDASLRSIITTIRDIRTIIAVVASARMFTKILEEGIQFDALLESSRLGLAALIGTFTLMEDAQGRQLSALQRYAVGQKMAVDLQHLMKVAALETTLQYSDLLDVMQRGLPFMLKYMHDAQGNVIDNKKLVNFTTTFSQGATAFGLQPEEIGTNIQRLLMGSADPRHARFAYALLQDIGGGDMKQAREQMALWEQQGVLYDKLMEKMAAFGQLGKDAMNTYNGALSNFKDAVQQALGEGTQDATKQLTQLLLDLRNQIVLVGADGKMYFDQNFVDTVKNLASAFVTLAQALAGVATILAAIGAHMDKPNIKNLLAALGGGIGGGFIGGPFGAGAGALAMYFSANVGDDIEAEAKASAEQQNRWRAGGNNVLGSLPPDASGHGFGIMAGSDWGGGNEQLAIAVGRLREEMNDTQFKAFQKGIIDASPTKHYNVGSSNDYYNRELSYMDFIKARKTGFAAVDEGPKIKSPKIDPDAEKVRMAALALENYRQTLEGIGRELDKGKIKASFQEQTAAIDALIQKTKQEGLDQKALLERSKVDPEALKAYAKANEGGIGKAEDIDSFLKKIDDEIQRVEHLNTLKEIGLQKDKDDKKAAEDYATAQANIEGLEAKLSDAKEKAKLSKFKPEDVELEKQVAQQIVEAKSQADLKYQQQLVDNAAKAQEKISTENLKDTEHTNALKLEMQKNAYTEYVETGISLEEALANAAVETSTAAWQKHYANRKKMLEDELRQERDLYQGFADDIKKSLNDVILHAMQGGKGENPLKGLVSGMQQTLANYISGFADQWMAKLRVIAGGEHVPYGYTKKGETGPSDPGGLPQYATEDQTQNARYGLAAMQGVTALYGLYAAGQAGATPGQNALSGAVQGAAIGTQIYPGWGTLIGAAVGAIAGYLTGKAKVAYNVSVTNGKISVSGDGSANDQDVASALAGINSMVESTANSLYGVLFNMPAAALQALSTFKPGQLTQAGTRWFTNDSMKLFLQQDIPNMVFASFQPALESGLSLMGVTQSKLNEIFARVSKPGFDAKDFIAKLNDYVLIITGLQDAIKFMGMNSDNGTGWDAKAEFAHDKLHPSAYSQISDIDAKIAGITGLFGSMTWDEQVAAGKQLLQLAQQRVQIEMQALDQLRTAWLAIEDTTKKDKESIAYSQLTDPFDPAKTASNQSDFWRGKAATAMQNLLGLYGNKDATVDDVNKYAQEAQDAAMQLYQTMKSRYDTEMQLIHQIDDAVKSVQKGFDDSKFSIQLDQARLGTDENGNPIYDKKKQADMVLAQQRDLFNQLKVASDPAEVAQISAEIQKNAAQLYDLWGRTPEAAKQVLAQLTDAGNIAADTLKKLRDAAQAEADKYKNAADDALAILKATADIANAVIADIQHRIESLDPDAQKNLNIAMTALAGVTDTAATDIDNLGTSATRTSRKLDQFGENLLSWGDRFGGGNSAPGNSATTQSLSASAPAPQQTPVVILNGSVAAVVSEVEFRIGDKIYRRSVNTMQRSAARGGNYT